MMLKRKCTRVQIECHRFVYKFMVTFICFSLFYQMQALDNKHEETRPARPEKGGFRKETEVYEGLQ